jgi:hypothetical protein
VTLKGVRRAALGRPSQSVHYREPLSSLAARNATFFRALILIASPVVGFRPLRAASFLMLKIPQLCQIERSTVLHRVADQLLCTVTTLAEQPGGGETRQACSSSRFQSASLGQQCRPKGPM